ncbi:MAG: NADPH:quinone reductase [Alphaproteobacteria bacterium]|jgi:NADPH2:quinone reductase|nr:NADPH:quinone reductase [Alphaproteobacteria bacterium]MDP6516535.1 NADPH:quinone reductase [Alphaproteobacteria bacterium]
MKAIVAHKWGGPEVLNLEEVADVEAGAGEVLIDLKAVGINPYETYIRSGVYAHLPDLPCVLGGDGAGVVQAVDAGVSGIEVGQRVYVAGTVGGRMTGCYAEMVTRPAEEVFPLPDAVSFGAGAAVGVPYATAYYALFQRGRAKPGETLFIHGASGAVGTAAIQLARASGLYVIGSAGSDRGRDLVLAQGAHHVVDHTQDGYLETLPELTDGQGPDLILEMLANVNLENDLDVVARYGRIVVIGNRGMIEINPRAAMMKDVDVLGLALWNCPADELMSIHLALIAGLENGSLKPVVGREMPLAEASQAHIAVLEPGAYGKIVLIP